MISCPYHHCAVVPLCKIFVLIYVVTDCEPCLVPLARWGGAIPATDSATGRSSCVSWHTVGTFGYWNQIQFDSVCQVYKLQVGNLLDFKFDISETSWNSHNLLEAQHTLNAKVLPGRVSDASARFPSIRFIQGEAAAAWSGWLVLTFSQCKNGRHQTVRSDDLTRLQQAANLGDPMAANFLAERYAHEADGDALRYYRQAALAGQLPTRYNIGALALTCVDRSKGHCARPLESLELWLVAEEYCWSSPWMVLSRPMHCAWKRDKNFSKWHLGIPGPCGRLTMAWGKRIPGQRHNVAMSQCHNVSHVRRCAWEEYHSPRQETWIQPCAFCSPWRWGGFDSVTDSVGPKAPRHIWLFWVPQELGVGQHHCSTHHLLIALWSWCVAAATLLDLEILDLRHEMKRHPTQITKIARITQITSDI